MLLQRRQDLICDRRLYDEYGLAFVGDLKWRDAKKIGERMNGIPDGNVSLLTTHLGAGWVRIVLPVRQLQVGPGML